MFAIGFALLFMAALTGLALQGTLPAVIPVFYAAASSVTAIVYRLDKSAAERHARRIPERTLHVMALIGGWPGALVAQRVFRHKSRKVSFQVAFWITVALNCAALILLAARP
jgi:uncharacterized membrane protein YsdA (DUF1294 family)